MPSASPTGKDGGSGATSDDSHLSPKLGTILAFEKAGEEFNQMSDNLEAGLSHRVDSDEKMGSSKHMACKNANHFERPIVEESGDVHWSDLGTPHFKYPQFARGTDSDCMSALAIQNIKKDGFGEQMHAFTQMMSARNINKHSVANENKKTKEVHKKANSYRLVPTRDNDSEFQH